MHVTFYVSFFLKKNNKYLGAANRYVYTGGELKKLPSGFKELFAGAASGEMLPAALLAGVVKDALLAKKADPRFYSAREAMEEKDESVFDFASRRLGKTVATFFIDPLCVGVFGGDARKLSLKSCFPILADFEAKEGSVVLGAIRQDVNTAPLPEPEPGTKRLLEYVDGARVWTLQRGMSSLTEGTHITPGTSRHPSRAGRVFCIQFTCCLAGCCGSMLIGGFF